MIRPRSASLAWLVVPLALGCTDAAADKAGGARAEPLVLTIGTDDLPGRVSAEQIEHFASRVDELSGGAIRIEPVWHAAGTVPDWDQAVARMVQRGELDMGLIPSRAWDTEGVTSLTALNAPFLITSDALLADVIQSELAEDLLSGLEAAGVTGLAMFPGGLRHPFGAAGPFLGPEDYAGRVIRSPTSAAVTALLEALGATTNDDGAFDASRSQGMESGYLEFPDVAFATGNVTYFPKVLVLVVNREAFAALGEDERSVLTAAAADTRTWAIETIPTDREAAEAWCRDGGTIVSAPPSDVEALEAATAGVTDALAVDPLTSRLIDEIARRKASTVHDDGTVECAGGRAPPRAAESTSGDVFPSGIYRYQLTRQDLIAAGVENEGVLNDNVGIFTWTMQDGRYCFTRQMAAIERPEVCGRYDVAGDLITVHLPAGSPTGRWSIEADGDLVLGPTDDGAPADPVLRATTARPWRRIGDVEP